MDTYKWQVMGFQGFSCQFTFIKLMKIIQEFYRTPKLVFALHSTAHTTEASGMEFYKLSEVLWRMSERCVGVCVCCI